MTGLGTRYLFLAVIAFVMSGLGMSLTPSASGTVLRKPKVVLVGLSGQLLFLPPLAFLLAFVLPVAESIRIGLVALAAGSMVGRLAMMTGLPIALGMTLRGLAPGFCLAALRPFRILSLVLVLAIVAISVRDALGLLREDALEILLATFALAATVVPGACVLARLSGLQTGERTAVAVEVGVQNTPLALLVGAMLVGMPELGITPVAYGLLNYLFIAVLLVWLRGRREMPASPG